MIFFFVGGLNQQVRQVLKSGAGRCINCGSKADLVDYEKVLKLFFLPVWRWPGKEPIMYCNNCSLFFPQTYPLPPKSERSLPAVPDILSCRGCGGVIDNSEFNFCPYCGSAL